MTRGDIHPRATSYEHLFENDRGVRTGFRIGILAATAIHLTIFAITWPTVAQNVPEDGPRTRHIYRLKPVVFERPQPEIVLPQAPQRRGMSTLPHPVAPAFVPRGREDWPECDIHPKIIDPPETILPPPPPAQSGPMTVRVGHEIEAPRLIHRVRPRYPAAAKKLHLTGPVIVEMLIDTDGRVVEVSVLRGLPFGLTESAVEAARQWRFEPSTFEGRPVSVRYTLTIRFQLESRM